MDDLRLILLLIGAGIIGAVYAWRRLQSWPLKSKSSRRQSVNRQTNDEPDDAEVEQELERMQQLVQGEEVETNTGASERLQVISVVAPDGEAFSGEMHAQGAPPDCSVRPGRFPYRKAPRWCRPGYGVCI